MTKGPDAFRTISEVSEELNVPQHVLRFWETRFSQIRPLKRSGGRRFYRPDDVALLRGIRHLLYGAGYTIRGVQRILKEQGIAHVQRIVPVSGDGRETPVGVTLADGPGVNDLGADEDFSTEPDFSPDRDVGPDREPDRDEPAGTTARIAEDVAPAHDGMPGLPAHEGDGDGFPHDVRTDAPHETGNLNRDKAPDHGPDVYGGYAAAWEPAPESGVASEGALHAGPARINDPIINRYAPGPLSARADRTGAGRPPNAEGDRIIQPQYRLTTDTRQHLQSVLDEIRECRRLLNSALSRLQD